MALRIEYILLLSLAILTIFIFIEKPTNIKAIKSNSSKEVYFKNFSLLELDENGVKNQLIASEATKDKNSFYLIDINITHNKTHKLLAKKAIYIKDFIYLENDVWLKRDDGFEFWTNNLNYKVKEKTAYTDTNFIINIYENQISGKELYYNLNTRIISAKDVNASIKSLLDTNFTL